MAIPTQAVDILNEYLQAGVGSAAALAWQHDGDRALLALGQTALAPWPRELVTPDSRFDLASLTKPMATLTLLVRELGAGTIALGDRLDAHLPVARGTIRGAATIGQLLSHTSGAPAWQDFFAASRESPQPERAAMVRAAVLNQANEYAAGTKAIYSDLGYMALGWLLEHRLEQPLDELFQARIAAPLGLQAGYRRLSGRLAGAEHIVATEVWQPRGADEVPLQGVVHDDNCAALDGVAGHAGLFGSVADVAAWADCWLAAVRETRRPSASPLELPTALCRALIATPGCADTSWRHGWDTPSRPGSSAGENAPLDAFGHLGFTGTSVWFSPSSAAFAVLLTNRVHPSRVPVAGIRALRPRVHDALWQTLA